MSNNVDSPGPYSPGPRANTVRSASGETLAVPPGWELLPPGDPGLTRRVKAAGEHWVVQQKKGRRMFSLGVYAPSATIATIREQLLRERADPAYAKRRAADARRREKTQTQYVEDFRGAVTEYLRFHPRHAELARRIAEAVTAHATPVGSGTVARTSRIPLERRAEAAVIAWMRHQTTAYDSMRIPAIKGRRREVRRQLARHSKEVLARYRDDAPPPIDCPLSKATRSSPLKPTL